MVSRCNDQRREPFKALRFVLIDADLEFGESLLDAASKKGYYVDCYRSMLEVGFLGRFMQYDAAIVNQQLGEVSGVEVAEYCDKLLGNLPLVLIGDTRTPRCEQDRRWPRSIYRGLAKSEGVDRILAVAHDAVESHQQETADHFFDEAAVGIFGSAK